MCFDNIFLIAKHIIVNSLRSIFPNLFYKKIAMSTEDKTFEITTILFESNDSSVLVKGRINQGNMNYSSDITISMSQLNQVLNQLRRKNEQFELEDLMISERMYNDEILFTININQSYNSSVNLNELTNQDSIRQIRA